MSLRLSQLIKLFDKVLSKSFPESPLFYSLLVKPLSGSDTSVDLTNSESVPGNQVRDLYLQTVRAIKESARGEMKRIAEELGLEDKLRRAEEREATRPIIDEATGERLTVTDPEAVVVDIIEEKIMVLTALAEKLEAETAELVNSLEEKRNEVVEISNVIQFVRFLNLYFIIF